MNKTIKERIAYVAEIKDIRDYEMEKRIGLSNGVLRRFDTDIKGVIVGNFLREFPDVNPTWLILGTGDAFISQRYDVVSEPTPPYRVKKNDESITLPMAVYQAFIEQLKIKDVQIAEKDKQLENCAAQIATYMTALNQ